MKEEEINNWVDRCRQGDREAYALLVGAFQQKVFGLCWQYLRDSQSARDAAADVFCKAFTALKRYEPGRSFGAWLLGIAGKHLLQMKRSERRRGFSVDLSESDLIDPGASPEEMLLSRYDRQSVETALAGLPEAYRLVLHLRYYEDLSYEEIAAAVDKPKSTVGSLISRAKGLMRRELAARGRHE